MDRERKEVFKNLKVAPNISKVSALRSLAHSSTLSPVSLSQKGLMAPCAVPSVFGAIALQCLGHVSSGPVDREAVSMVTPLLPGLAWKVDSL